MALQEPIAIVFVDSNGAPLPDWIQIALRPHIPRLSREFPALRNDLAVIQNILDRVGQRIIGKVEAGENIDNVQAYLYTACTNAAIDLTRTHEMFNGCDVGDIEAAGHVAANEHDAELLLDKLGDFLNAQEEELLVRFHFYGEKHKEISKALGLSETAVRSRLSRARDKARQHLKSLGISNRR
jgi:RNA polymerase sigma factor (sigma-70 family)